MAGTRILKVSEEVYSILKAIKDSNNAKSFSEAIKLLAEGKVEKVTVSNSKPTERVSGENGGSDQSIKRQLIELRAMVQKILDLTESGKLSQNSQNPQNLAIEKCPYCGLNFRGNRVKAELLTVHLPLPRIGIELLYKACPSCEKPLSEITWKPMEQG